MTTESVDHNTIKTCNCGSADDGLARLGNVLQTSSSIEHRTEVLAIAMQGLTVGDSDTDPQQRIPKPVRDREFVVDRLARLKGGQPIAEGSPKRIACPPEDFTAM